MKHIKSINEFYHRTMGFRYSEPALRFSITCYYQGIITEEQLSQALENIGNLKFEKVEVNTNNAKRPIRDVDEVVQNVGINGSMDFDILIYNEREIDSIMENLTKSLYIDYKVRVVDVSINEIGRDK